MKRILFIVFAYCGVTKVYSQSSINYNKGTINTNVSAVPFLMICPDARAAGMGNLGAASSPDANSMVWNPAKYAFTDKSFAMSVSFAPYYAPPKRIEMYLLYASAYKKLGQSSALAASLRYFTLGSVQFTDANGNAIGTYKPNEFALDLGYSRKLSSYFSVGLAGRYIYSNLTNSVPLPNGTSTHSGQTYAADIAIYYRNNQIKLAGNNAEIAGGFNISNVGPKISYTDNQYTQGQDFIPTLARLGGSLKINLDDYNSITFLSDLSQLLIPSPIIITGLNDELQKLNKAVGIEYWYSNLFALRAGYYHQDSLRGNYSYLTMGLGLKYNVIAFDFAYFAPLSQTNISQNTIRLSLTATIATLTRQKNIPAAEEPKTQ